MNVNYILGNFRDNDTRTIVFPRPDLPDIEVAQAQLHIGFDPPVILNLDGDTLLVGQSLTDREGTHTASLKWVYPDGRIASTANFTLTIRPRVDGDAYVIESSVDILESIQATLLTHEQRIELLEGATLIPNHDILINRDLPNQHPMGAITGLTPALDTKVTTAVGNATQITFTDGDTFQEKYSNGELNGTDGVDGYTPIKGVDYFDGVDGTNGTNGTDGYTPIKGVDYFDGEDGADGLTTSVNNVQHINGNVSLTLDNIPDGTVRVLGGGSGGSTVASAVEFTPTGDVSATDVQAAIAELDTEKSALDHLHTGTYQPVGSYLTAETDPVFTAWGYDYSVLINTPTIPTKVSELTNDSGFIVSETDPVFTAWDKSYSDLTDVPTSFTPSAHKTTHATGGTDALTASDVGAESAGSVSTHNADGTSHTDIRTSLEGKSVFHGIETIGALSFDDSTRVLSFTGVTYWYQGVKYTTTGVVSCDLDDYVTVAPFTLYYVAFDDSSGTLKAFSSMNLRTRVPVGMVYWNGTSGAVTLEHHGHTRNLDWHINAHRTIGTRYFSGLGVTAPTTVNDSSLSIQTGIIYDEDIALTITPQTAARLWRQTSNGVYTFSDINLPYAGVSGTPQYLNTNTYALTNVGTNNFTCCWVYATNDKDRPIYIVPSQATAPHNTLTIARGETPPVLTGLASELAPEWKLIYRFIYKGDGEFQELSDYRLATSLPSGQVATAQAASAVTVVPVGDISATNVQSALEELDTEKSSTAHLHTGVYQPVGAYLTVETDPLFTAWGYDYSVLINKPSIPVAHGDLTGVGTNNHDTIDTHLGATSNPHGTALTQTQLNYTKAAATVVNIGNVTGSLTVNFTNGSVQRCVPTGNVTSLTISGLSNGERGVLFIKSNATARTIAAPTSVTMLNPIETAANKVTAVTFVHDGSTAGAAGIIGSSQKGA